ncbi:hypothetical protein PCS8106_01686 [Streptococcus pneumoniae PCS8106]|nr:hypothetical protein PCS8106_01686 [Streptococcus pneumoniae PCS8106]
MGLHQKHLRIILSNYDAFLEALLSYSCFSRLYSVIGQLRNSRWDDGRT